MEGESSRRWGKLREIKQKLKIRRKSSKECEKLLKKAATEGENTGITILSPFKHTVHVDHDFTWSMDSEESFKMDKLLGEGSYGSVYKSTAPGGKVVAIKKVIFDTDDTESSYSDYNTDSDMSIIDEANFSDDNSENDEEMSNSNQNQNQKQNQKQKQPQSSFKKSHPSKSKREEMKDLVFEMERKKISKEIELLKQLDSKYIVQYYGSTWKSKKELWIIMEYCKFGLYSKIIYCIPSG
jgi:serine/threonine protein kinase